MSVKKGQSVPGTEVSKGEGSQASGDGAGTETKPSAPPPPSEEQRIQDQAAAKLEQKTGELAVKLQQAEARANALQGELDRASASLKASEKQVAELGAALAAATTAAKNAGTAISGLPDNARQLNECVTIASGVAGVGKGGRLHAKVGDVLMVAKSEDEVADLQRELGMQATVYRVSKATLDDLEQSGFLHR